MQPARPLPALGLLLAVGLTSPAQAVTYTTVAGTSPDFPLGAISFADVAVNLSGGLVQDPDGLFSLQFPAVQLFPAGTTVPLPFARNKDMALGEPDTTQTAVISCALRYEQQLTSWAPGCNSVSLGVGGTLTVQFTNNYLVGSGNSNLDLWIFETGPDVEDTFVEISKNGVNWTSVGKVFGSTAGVDIDAFGFGPGDLFTHVRLTDDPNEGELDGATVGADIDAIGAITTVVPAPASVWLLLTGLAGLARRQLRR